MCRLVLSGGSFGQVVPWVHIQQKYFDAKGRRNTGVKWASQVAKEVWKITWKYWGQWLAWAHSNQSLWYKEDRVRLQREVKE